MPIQPKKKTNPKKRTTATKVLKNPDNPNNKHAPKTVDAKFLLKAEIAVRLKRGQSRNFIYESLKGSGSRVSKQTVYTYSDELREEWIEAKNESYDVHVASQLARLDAMEEKLWEMMDASTTEGIKRSEEYSFQVKEEDQPSDEKQTVGRKSEGSDENPKGRTKIRRSEEIERKLISEKIEYVQRFGDIETMKMIERLWVRRNEVLGIQMLTNQNIQNNYINNGIVQNQNKVISEKFGGNFIIEEDIRDGMQMN